MTILKKIRILKMFYYFQCQINEVMIGGLSVFYRKTFNAVKLLSKNFLLVVGFIATTPIVLLVVLIRPLILIRFGTLDGSRLGHFCMGVEGYLCFLDLDVPTQLRLDTIGCPEPICNYHLKRMWERTFRITPGAWLWELMDQNCRFWTNGNRHHTKMGGQSAYMNFFLTTPPHLSFTQEEKDNGKKLLEQLGIPLGAPWICFHNRDSAYLDKAFPNIKWNYHNHRDFSIESMIDAAEELTRRGYYVVRTGATQREIISTSNQMIIDYAFSPYRSEFGDIFLGAGCSAYFGSDSGIADISLIFRKPICWINFSLTIVDLIPKRGCYSLPFITKHLFHKEKQRFLSLREMLEAGLYSVSESYKFEEAGVKAISNTQEELRELALEVAERLKGQWQPHPEDKVLQLRFWNIFREYNSLNYGDNKTPIGSAFLRQHSYLLD